MTDKTPLIVHCGLCKHEWAAFYLPMVVDDVAKIALSMHCPMCAEGAMEIFTGPAPVDKLNTSAERVKKTGES